MVVVAESMDTNLSPGACTGSSSEAISMPGKAKLTETVCNTHLQAFAQASGN